MGCCKQKHKKLPVVDVDDEEKRLKHTHQGTPGPNIQDPAHRSSHTKGNKVTPADAYSNSNQRYKAQEESPPAYGKKDDRASPTINQQYNTNATLLKQSDDQHHKRPSHGSNGDIKSVWNQPSGTLIKNADQKDLVRKQGGTRGKQAQGSTEDYIEQPSNSQSSTPLVDQRAVGTGAASRGQTSTQQNSNLRSQEQLGQTQNCSQPIQVGIGLSQMGKHQAQPNNPHQKPYQQVQEHKPPQVLQESNQEEHPVQYEEFQDFGLIDDSMDVRQISEKYVASLLGKVTFLHEKQLNGGAPIEMDMRNMSFNTDQEQAAAFVDILFEKCEKSYRMLQSHSHNQKPKGNDDGKGEQREGYYGGDQKDRSFSIEKKNATEFVDSILAGLQNKDRPI